MEINCEQIVEKYLLNQSPLYSFSFPLSLLIAIIVFGCSKAYKWSDNSYINQILIPIVAFLISMVAIDIISRMLINKDIMQRLVQKCKLWMHDPSVKNHPILSKMIDMNLVLNYNTEEGFTTYKEDFQNNEDKINNNVMNIIDNINNLNSLKENKKYTVENLIDKIPHISPEPLKYTNYDNAMCIQSSNCCTLCSGSENSNPCNLIAPIPGPQWIPQSAESVQKRLVSNNYSEAKCKIVN